MNDLNKFGCATTQAGCGMLGCALILGLLLLAGIIAAGGL